METFRFEPPGQTPGKHAARAYVFRTPTLAERHYAFRRAIVAAGGVWHGEMAMTAALEREAKALLAAPSDADALAAVNAALAEMRAAQADLAGLNRAAQQREAVLPPKDATELAEDERAAVAQDAARREAIGVRLAAAGLAVAEIEQAIIRAGGRYAGMCADRDSYFTIRGQVALRLFLIEWEGIDGKVERGVQGVTDAALARVPPADVDAVGWWCMNLFEPDEATRKNSVSRSDTGSTATISTTGSGVLH